MCACISCGALLPLTCVMILTAVFHNQGAVFHSPLTIRSYILGLYMTYNMLPVKQFGVFFILPGAQA